MEKIAIIGLSCLFPGASTPEQFWHNLIEGKNTTSPATRDDLGVEVDLVYDRERSKADTSYFMRGGYVRDFEFDPTGYRFPADMLVGLDQSVQWSLYVAREALRDCSYIGRTDVLARCGVILGNLSLPTRRSHQLIAPLYDDVIASALGDLLDSDALLLARAPIDALAEQVFTPGYPAAMVAHALGLSGINFALDAACASSLYAVALACDYLASGKADLMLAGAVSAADPLFVNFGFSAFEAYPEDGRNQPLDASSSGLISSEGAGMMVLKRHADALRDGDPIYALISGIGLSNDGRGKHVLTPNSKGQTLAIQRAYADSDVQPEQIVYVECHASGTPLGDKTELNSLETFFSPYGNVPLIGSVKANTGHLLTTAGFASMLKIVLSMVHDQIPPTIGIQTPLTSQNNLFTGQQIVTRPIDWPRASETKYAGINAFGFGGVSAHLILQDNDRQAPDRATDNQLNKTELTPMAIVGMDAHFGSLDGLDAFARAIYEGEQAFIPLPPQRWKGIEHQRELLQGFGYESGEAPVGAYIDQFDIDFMRFKIPPNSADQPVPQQLLLMKVADNALRDAGLREGGNVAVIVALGADLALHQSRARVDLSWQIKDALAKAGIALTPDLVAEVERITKDSLHTPAEVNQYTSYIGNLVSSRVSALWNFSGPAFTVSAEENSVFKALEVAQLLLRRSEVDAVVVGAVDLAGGAENVLLRGQLSPPNTGTPTLGFDRNANGWMVGEGAGAVVLVRQDQAATRNEHTYAVIDAIQILQSAAQTMSAGTVAQVSAAAMASAGLSPDDIGYLEVFGSGIAREDEVEVEGLLAAYHTAQPDLTCALGSVKANVGHTFAASGMASLIKTALVLDRRFIPATPAWNGPKTPEAWAGSPFYVATRSKTWFLERGAVKRHAAVNGLGADGAAAHLILSEAPVRKTASHSLLTGTRFYLFPIGASSRAELVDQLEQLAREVERADSLNILASRWFAAYQSRQNSAYTLSIVGHNPDEVQREIGHALKGIDAAFAQNGEWFTPLGSYFTANPLGSKGTVAFVYPGAFNSYPKMGQDLFQLFPRVHDSFTSITSDLARTFADRLISPRSLDKLSHKGWNAARTALENDPVAMMESGTSFSILVSKIMQDYFKVLPAATFGYSLGEGSMLWSLGVWVNGDQASVGMHTSPLFTQRLFGRKDVVREIWGLPSEGDDFWAAYFISAPVEEVRERIRAEQRVYLTHINTPNEVMIAGDPAACKRVVEALGREYLRAPFSVVIHCEAVMPEYAEFFRLHSLPVVSTPDLTFYSAADYSPTALEQSVIAHNIARVSCKPVDFPRLVNRVYDDGARIFIELGPRSTCARWIDESLGERDHLAVSINQLGVDDRTAIVRLLAKLASHRLPLDLSPLYEAVQQSAVGERSLIKTITLGGEDIRAVILSEENRRKFEGVVVHTAPQATVNAAAPVYEAPAAHAQSIGAAHGDFLRSRQHGLRQLGDMLREQMSAVEQGRMPAAVQSPVVAPAAPPPRPAAVHKPALFQLEAIEQFAKGSVAACFGSRYEIYSDRRAPRVPNGDLLLISRVLKIEGERYKSEPGTSILTEYDVPADAWFYLHNAYPSIPYSVYMEIALQPCGFLSAYHGPTLDFPEIDFYFRNLDGQGRLLREIDLRGRTITNRVNMINSTVMQGIIIQKFDFELSCDGEVFYQGDATFGYFTKESLASQAGLDRGKTTAAWYQEQPALAQSPIADAHTFYRAPVGKPHYRLPQGQLGFLDDVLIVPDGGKYSKGYIYGINNIEPDYWFFACHFHEDPVMPGSLGVEAILQSMQAYAIQLDLGRDFKSPRFAQAEDHNTVWRYRGQVLSTSPDVKLEVHISDVRREAGQITIVGDASLWRDDFLRIYELKGAAITIREA
jgi:PfaB family protein